MSAPPGTSSNPFEILGLARSATFEDVKLAYRRLARQHHPDANPDDPTALERFTALRRAYDRLKIFYQTLDEAGPAVKAAPRPADTQRPAQTQGSASTAARAAASSAAAARAAARAAAPAAAAPPRDRDVMPEPASAGAGVPEPTLQGTGNRRAFRRTGPIHQSGNVDIQGVAQPVPAPTARAAAVRL